MTPVVLSFISCLLVHLMFSVVLSLLVVLVANRLAFIYSVVVREDKKLLTVLFPDGRDGRAFTLKVTCYLLLFISPDLVTS